MSPRKVCTCARGWGAQTLDKGATPSPRTSSPHLAPNPFTRTPGIPTMSSRANQKVCSAQAHQHAVLIHRQEAMMLTLLQLDGNDCDSCKAFWNAKKTLQTFIPCLWALWLQELRFRKFRSMLPNLRMKAAFTTFKCFSEPQVIEAVLWLLTGSGNAFTPMNSHSGPPQQFQGPPKWSGGLTLDRRCPLWLPLPTCAQ